jgi:hypothetical protein
MPEMEMLPLNYSGITPERLSIIITDVSGAKIGELSTTPQANVLSSVPVKLNVAQVFIY